jgi:hypothetical protein
MLWRFAMILEWPKILRVFLLSLAFPSVAVAATYVVSPDGTGDFATIQTAIDAATSGDVIELSEGTFRGNGNRDISFLGKAIAIRSQSGIAKACIIDCQGDPDSLHRGFIFESGEGSESILEAVTITNGYISEPYPQSYGGGGVYLRNESSPTMIDCILASNGGDVYALGGGIYCTERSSPTLTGCSFIENKAFQGDGMFCDEGSVPELHQCVFSENDGDGLRCTHAVLSECDFIRNTGSGISADNIDLTDCVFTENSGRGLGVFVGGTVTIRGCTFSRNTTRAREGGGARILAESVSVIDCLFEENECEVWGGGLHVYAGHAEIERCRFVGNSAANGGGLYLDVRQSQGEPVEALSWCTFIENQTTGRGGGMTCRGRIEVANCTFYVNSSRTGAGVYLEGGGPIIRNSIVASNLRGEAIACDRNVEEITLTCCNLYGNEGGDWSDCVITQGPSYGGPGNMSEDPLFCDPEHGDLHLQTDSPCAPFSDPNDECDLIGALPADCTAPAVKIMTWGGIKTTYHP